VPQPNTAGRTYPGLMRSCGGLLPAEMGDMAGFKAMSVPVCREVTHPFALKLTTLTERNWLGRSVSDASAESSKLSL